VIPFTDGVTLGEGMDWFGGFVDKFYSKLVSTEIAVPLPGAELGVGPYNGSFSIQFAGADTTVHNISFSGNYATGQAGLRAAINAGILAAGLNLRLVARENRDGVLAIAFTEAEILAGTTGFTITLGDMAWVDIGFPVTGAAQTISRYTIEQFPTALNEVVDPLHLFPDIAYDDQQKLYIFPVEVVFAGSPETVEFDFGTEIGPLGTASLNGEMDFTPQLSFKFDLGLDLNPADIPRIYSSQFIPAPSNGRISADLEFDLYLNNSPLPITVELDKVDTNDNSTLAHLAEDLNDALTAALDYTPPGGVPTDLLHFVRFDAAGTILVLS
jgi:hypothetical protein